MNRVCNTGQQDTSVLKTHFTRIVPMHFTFMQHTDAFISRDLHRIQGIHSASLCTEPLTEQQEDLDQPPQNNPQHFGIVYFN